MFTTVAWSDSLNPAGAMTKLDAVADRSIKTAGDSIYVSSFNRLLGAMALCGATSPAEARLTSPRLRRFAPFYIRPVEADIHPAGLPAHCVDPDNSIVLDIDEQLEVEMNPTPGGVAQLSAVAWLADALIQKVSGEMFTVEAEITVALAVETWNFSEMTFSDDLPVGAYDIVGMSAVIDGGVCARLVPVGAYNRPGVPPVSAVQYDDMKSVFRYGKLGVWSTFPHNNIPGVEVLGSAAVASATYKIFLDLIKRS